MGERSVYASLILTILLIVLVLGLWMVNDNISVVKNQMVKNEQAMSRIADSAETLTKALRNSLANSRTAAANPLCDVANPSCAAETCCKKPQGNATNENNGDIETAQPITKNPTNSQPETASSEFNGYKGKNKFANDDLDDPNAVNGGVTRTATRTFPGNFNYIIKGESFVGTLWGYCNDSLAERHNINTTEFEPMLAENWNVSDDGLVYTIRLRKGAFWHPYTDLVTGKKVPEKEVTSDDFLFYWEVIQNENVPCDPLRSYFKFVDRIEVIDRYTFKVVWTQPYSLSEEQTLGLSPYPRHYYRPETDKPVDDATWAEQLQSSPRNQWVVGCGKYMLEKWESGQGLTLVRNPNYYGTKPHIERISFREIKDPEIMFNEFKKGNLDLMALSPTQWTVQTPEPQYYTVTKSVETAIEDSKLYDDLKKQGKKPEGAGDFEFEKYRYLGGSYSYIGYNQKRKMFQDKRVRQALTHLVDRRRILTEVYKDLGTIQTGPFLPQSPYNDPAVKPFEFDVEKALALLKEAGWIDTDKDGLLDNDLDGDGKREIFTFRFMTISVSPEQRKMASIIREDMLKVGIKMEIGPLEWSVYLQMLEEKTFDVCSLGWSGGIFESDPYQIWHSSQADLPKSSNHIYFKNAEADKLIETGRVTMDKNKRTEIYRQFHRLIHEEQPYTFLFAGHGTVARQPRYRNVRVYKVGLDGSQSWLPMALQVE